LPDEHYQVKEKFYGKRAGITVEQSLFDYSAISTYRIGKTQAQYADVQYRLQVQQEAVTLIDTYLNALLARDTLQLAQYQLQVYEDMLRDNQRLIDRGEGTRIDTLEHGLLPLQRLDLPTLLKDANEQNPQMQAARLSVQYSDLTIEKAKGEFMPKVSAFASREHIESDNIDNMGRDYYDNTIGIQVSIPLFNGGSSYYTARQAYSRREQAQYELEHTSNSTATLLEQYFRVTDTSLSRIRTLRQNVTESEDLVQAMRRSVAGGERTNTDALQAERQAFQARLALIRSYVEWFQAYGKLQFYAGRFSEDDIVVLNRQLVMARQ
jgi:protease secretion system outer membrane protein